VTLSIRALRLGEVDAVVEFSVRAWRPVFESFTRVMGPEIFRRIYPDWQAIQAEAVADACRAEGNRVWVAEADGSLAGFIVVVVHRLNPETESGEIYMVAVDPDYQNEGIGLALVNFAVDRIAELGIPLAEIGTGGDPGHAPARRVYEKAGFTPVPLVRYYKALTNGRD
jgi:ribosomal protein S18 acetylase RimI-like enzyme